MKKRERIRTNFLDFKKNCYAPYSGSGVLSPSRLVEPGPESLVGGQNVPKGKRPVLSVEQQRAIKGLTFHAAQDAFHIGFQTWKAIREAEGFLPFRGNGDAVAELEERVLASVREKPHLATGARARELGVSIGAVQTVLRRRRLSKLHARLEFAGYRVEACRPLEVARQRRILATYPGALAHIDFKTFGYLRPPRGQAQQAGERLGGFVCIDSLTRFATCFLSSTCDQFQALEALDHYRTQAPFPLRGLLLTDNAKCFLADTLIKGVANRGLLQRTIRASHPWSNSKVEALNKVLKYQCFPAIAGDIRDWQSACVLVDRWMVYYNEQRSHGGFANKGLPPLALWQLYEKTPGDHLQKLIKLGLLKLDNEWSVRLMGSNTSMEQQQNVTVQVGARGTPRPHPRTPSPHAA